MSKRSGTDPYQPDRFVLAQGPVYKQVLSELKAGIKMSHWMWFIFPQIRGLGRSPVSVEYAISGHSEAQAYLQHPVLGPRLKECTRLVLEVESRLATEIFDTPDDMKFRSSMTLFAEVSPDDDIFAKALKKYFGGEPDRLTLDRL
jgi:uncharacterized protein (DUF1810 family)